MKEETIAILASPKEYAYHINQVASISVDNLHIIRKQFSVKSPYKLESIPMYKVERGEHKSGLAPLRIAAGILVLGLLAGITFYFGLYWERLEPGTRIQVGLFGLAIIYGLKWAFMSRRHELTFHLQGGDRVRWRSRSGDFKYKQRAVENVIAHFRGRGLIQ